MEAAPACAQHLHDIDAHHHHRDHTSPSGPANHQSREHVLAQQHHKLLEMTDKAHLWNHGHGQPASHKGSMDSLHSHHSSFADGNPHHHHHHARSRASRAVPSAHSSASRFRSLMYLLEQEHEREIHAARNGIFLSSSKSSQDMEDVFYSLTQMHSHNGHSEHHHHKESIEGIVGEAFRERDLARAAKRQSAFHRIPGVQEMDVRATTSFLRNTLISSNSSSRASAMIGCIFPPTPPGVPRVTRASVSGRRRTLSVASASAGVRSSRDDCSLEKAVPKSLPSPPSPSSPSSSGPPGILKTESLQAHADGKKRKGAKASIARTSIPSEERVPTVPAFSGPRTNLLHAEDTSSLVGRQRSLEHSNTEEKRRVTFDAKKVAVAEECESQEKLSSGKKNTSRISAAAALQKLKEETDNSDEEEDESGSGQGSQSLGVYGLRLSEASSSSSNEGDFMRVTRGNRTGHIVFSLHASWKNTEDDDEMAKADILELQRAQTHDTMGELQVLLMSHPDEEKRQLERDASQVLNMQRCVMSPSGSISQLCGILLMLIVLYDAVAIPLVVFDLDENWWTVFIEWTTRIVWTLEVPRSFCTGYLLKNGTAEMRPRLIANHYLKTWFIFDCCIAGFDWVEWVLLSGLSLDMSRQGGILRLLARFRIARILPRVLRMSRLPGLSEKIGDYFYSQRNILFLGILKVSILFIFLVHYIACTWYGIGSYSKGTTWLDDYTWWDKEFSYRYAICLHWAITQFIGNNEVNPVNLQERYFCGLCLIFSFLMSASFVSRLAASMTRLHMLTGQQDVKVALLRQYLSHNKVPAELSGRVVRVAEYAEKEKNKTISEADVDLLAFLTEPLMMEIHYEVYSKTLCLHPFFTHFQRIDIATMRRICHRAVAAFSLAAGDVLFNIGERPSAPQMFFLTKGMMLYMKPDGSRFLVETGTFICEKVLWTTWVHVGTLCTFTNCNLVSVDATELQCVMSGKYSVNFALDYAKAYLKHLNETMQEDAFMVDDLNDGDFKTAEVTREIAGMMERRKRQVQFTAGNIGTQSTASNAERSRQLDVKRFTTVTRLSKSENVASRNKSKSDSVRHSAQSKGSSVQSDAS